LKTAAIHASCEAISRRLHEVHSAKAPASSFSNPAAASSLSYCRIGRGLDVALMLAAGGAVTVIAAAAL
jgi:hypothetical protein